jgi:pimeloyl-ACP methyl ester carboxylesterase
MQSTGATGVQIVAGINHHRAGSGDPLLLMHGIGSHWQVWKPVLPALEAAHEVIAIDLPGFGASPRPAGNPPPEVPTLTRLVIDFLDELGIERPHVGGNSLGGWLALELAKAGRAATATALSPGGFCEGAERAFGRNSLLATYRFARAVRPLAGPLSTTAAGRMTLWQYINRPWRVPAEDAADSLRALADATWFEGLLNPLFEGSFTGGERIQVPVTIAWGQHDRLLLMRQAPRAAQRIPRARMVTLYGCGHVPTYDDPGQVARVLLEGSSIKE